MKSDIPARVGQLADWQAGAISRRQLLDAGLTTKMIAGRLDRGHWQVLYRGVYAVYTGPPSRETQLWAAVLRAGDGAVLSHQTAAELHGLIDAPAGAICLTVPASRRVTSPGLLDLVQLAGTFDDVCGWITRACGRRLSTVKKPRAALAMRKKMRWRPELDDILAAAGDGIHSVLEYHYLRDVERAHGLPRSRHQVRAVLGGKVTYRDAYYQEYLAAVELDGRLAHPEEERWHDHRRDNAGVPSACTPAATDGVTWWPGPA